MVVGVIKSGRVLALFPETPRKSWENYMTYGSYRTYEVSGLEVELVGKSMRVSAHYDEC